MVGDEGFFPLTSGLKISLPLSCSEPGPQHSWHPEAQQEEEECHHCL